MRISDWSSDVCSSYLVGIRRKAHAKQVMLAGASSLLALAFASQASAEEHRAPPPAADQPAPATPAAATPQDQAAADASQETIVVTGIRGSLQRNLAIKRNATGVVDAISSEDIGKFPDSNLAASLQLLPGVSIQPLGSRGVPQGIPDTGH